MMRTFGEAVKYKRFLDIFSHILKNECMKSLFKGAGANILHVVVGAGVLAGYDKLYYFWEKVRLRWSLNDHL